MKKPGIIKGVQIDEQDLFNKACDTGHEVNERDPRKELEAVITVVWFKRDLRIYDHRPLAEAVTKGSVLPLFVFEPSVWEAGDVSVRHKDFVMESLQELDEQLSKRGARLYTAIGEMTDILQELVLHLGPFRLHAHEENGTPNTFRRDIAVRSWMKGKGFPMKEWPHFGVTRGLKTRDAFQKGYEAYVSGELTPAPERMDSRSGQLPACLKQGVQEPLTLKIPGEGIQTGQKGGERAAHGTLRSFLDARYKGYQLKISKPYASADSCSRLSPYLAWGNVSVRYTYQETVKAIQQSASGFEQQQLSAFLSRLHWHCHFIQRIEDEPEIVTRTMNPAFDTIRQDWDEQAYQAWLQGKTGIPLIDAAMRCLHETGWLNFRSRAMVLSFVCNTLMLDWRRPSVDLARLFLDYEPGIHYSQVQMQAGTTGFNTIRIYNPVKQGQDHDAKGAFVRRFVPELRTVPDAFIQEPWKLPAGLPDGYPSPIVDVAKANGEARRILWSLKQSPEAREAAGAQLNKHGSRKESRRRSTKKPRQDFEQLDLFS
ncbi:FAD-binding domain-containing protein [Salisediminibacterium beveridgei]|uniref:Deoxyribodipyrimidine photolyase n=1 Tax=Salisediminibacterium beveridgei TaxID=632773 RepID=A0A1D7QZU6_9BACI|nr:deoxyribodipyrimidine photo-lyase [Salisediminibacterium beveridgei]AOM84522.1 Deoxyribodipyrimidine photolyase [Salisediminibacterium beveridgei]